jgi:hypothetical protein
MMGKISGMSQALLHHEDVVMVGSFILLIRDQMTYLDVDPEK